MPRNYPPMTSAQCVNRAQIDALNHWNGVGGLHNCGYQGAEYTTMALANDVMDRWRNHAQIQINGIFYDCVASWSVSGLVEIDLKLRQPGAVVSSFNYHIAIDSQVVAPRDQAKIDGPANAWKIVNNIRAAEYKNRHGGSLTGYSDLPFHNPNK